MRTTSKGLIVWDLDTDPYDHNELADNWDLVDSLIDTPTKQIEMLPAIPVTGNFAGRLVMLNNANGGFAAWTLIRFDGSAWRPVGSAEVFSVVPTSGNFGGRIVVLSAAASGFPAWSVIRYNGTSSNWDIVGGWSVIDNGAGVTNIRGLQNAQDAFISDSARGLVLVDRTSGNKYRLFFANGTLGFEQVT